MPRRSTVWEQWKRIARRAAAFQSNVLLWVLYYVVFCPVALVRRPFTDTLQLRTGGPAWRERAATGTGLETARRQF